MPQYNENVTPTNGTLSLGTLAQPWKVYASNIYVTGTLATITFSGTPVFDISAGTSLMITLTGSVSSSTATNANAGAVCTFIIKQDGTGGHAFVWPTNVLGAIPVGTAASQVTIQQLVYDGTNFYPTSTGAIYP